MDCFEAKQSHESVYVWRIDSFFILCAPFSEWVESDHKKLRGEIQMGKNLLRKLFLMLSMGLVLAGCGTDTAQEQEPAQTEEAETTNVEEVPESEEAAEDATEESETSSEEVTVDFDILIDGETVTDLSEEVTVPEGTYLLDAMHDTYDVQEEGGFISAIEGYEQDEDTGRYWLYYINDEMPSVGAAEYELEEGDYIEWRLEDSE